MTRLPHRSWCEVCIKARGREDAHASQMEKGTKPTIALDSKEFGEAEDSEDKITTIILKDEESGCMAAHVIEQKGSAGQWAVQRILDDIRMFGHTDIIMKGDGEPALVQVQREIGLEQRIQMKIDTSWKIVDSMVELAPTFINWFLVGIVEMGEKVLAKISRGRQRQRKQALQTRWQANCMPGWDGKTIAGIVATPRKPNPSEPDKKDIGTGVTMKFEKPEPLNQTRGPCRGRSGSQEFQDHQQDLGKIRPHARMHWLRGGAGREHTDACRNRIENKMLV